MRQIQEIAEDLQKLVDELCTAAYHEGLNDKNLIKSSFPLYGEEDIKKIINEVASNFMNHKNDE